MTTYPMAPLKLAAIRITKLDSCGVPDTGSCAMFAYESVIMIDQSGETVDATEFPLVNADGDLEEYQTDPGRLKYLGVDIQVSKAVPELIGWMTGDDVIHDNAAAPSAIGWRTQTNSSTLANFALEGWTRLSGVSSCSGGAAYGYIVWPWLVNGTFYTWKAENALTELRISAQTKKNSPWGVGPYATNLSKAVATLGHPWPLFEAVTADDHRHFQRTELAPPLTTVNCGPVVGPLAVVDDDGAGALLAATATLPLPVASTTPGVIDWGDLTPPAVIAAGALTATHVYAAAGPYTVTYTPSAQSGPHYVGAVVMA